MVDAVDASVIVAALVGLAALVSGGLAWYSWRRADHPVSDRFAVLLAADSGWATMEFAQLVSPTDALATAWLPVESTVAALAAALWFLFVIEYTGDSDWIPGFVEPLVVGQALAYGVLYVLNPAGIVTREVTVSRFGVVRLPVETFGPISLAEIAVIYVLLVASFVLLGRFYLQTRNLYRKQTGVILVVTTAIVVANAAFLAGLSPHPDLDLTTVFFVVQAVGVGFALYRYDFLTITPLAASKLLEEMTDPVFVVDSDGGVPDYNDAASAFLSGDARQPTVSDVDIDGFDGVLGTPDGGVGTARATAAREDEDHVVATYDTTTTPIRDQYGEVQGEVVVLRDISEQVASKRALEAQNERLEEFASIVSHDLRNPLQVLAGRIDLVRETGDLDHLDAAERSVERMETLIEDLLVLARQGNTIGERDSVDLASLAETAWQTVDADDGRLAIEADTTVTADRDRLQQVLENLFQNAVEHGGETVTVGDLPDGFYVADDGPGIPDAERERVFELGHTTTTDGTGIGLAIVERIVDAHGWSVAVTESSDGGARFEVSGVSAPDDQ